jgi:hypothetical protein
MAFLLLVSPWTEGYRLLDNFPHGQDSELSLLALLTFLGLVLLLARACTRNVCTLLNVGSWLSSVFQTFFCMLADPPAAAALPLRHIPPLGRVSAGSFNIPLQI